IESLSLDADAERDDDVGATREQSGLCRRVARIELDLCVRKQLLQLLERRRRQKVEVACACHAPSGTADGKRGAEATDRKNRTRPGAGGDTDLRPATDHGDLERALGGERENAVVLQKHDALA